MRHVYLTANTAAVQSKRAKITHAATATTVAGSVRQSSPSKPQRGLKAGGRPAGQRTLKLPVGMNS